MEKFNGSDDAVFKERAVVIKEERADLVKHHLWVLWTDYFKPEHLEKHPQLHELFWKATKAAGETKKTNDPKVAQGLLDQIKEIDDHLLGDQEGVGTPEAGGDGWAPSARASAQGEGQVVGAETGWRAPRPAWSSPIVPPQASHFP